MKKLAAAIAAVIMLSGCGSTDETYHPEKYVDSTEETPSSVRSSTSTSSKSDLKTSAISSSSVNSKRSAQNSVTDKSSVSNPQPTVVSHDFAQALSADGNNLSFTLENVFSEANYYNITVSATKTDIEGKNTVLIDGILYGDLALTLSKNGKPLDRMTLEVPEGEHFALLENAAESLSYGYEYISNMRDFDAPQYPDVVGLIFQGNDNEAAVPVYERFFTVFDGKLAELPIYENGYEVSPRGAKLEPKSAGVAVQHLTVLKSGGEGYEIVKYEYRFNLENKRLDKQQVKFYGWDY